MYPSTLQKLEQDTALKKAAIQKRAGQTFGDHLSRIRRESPELFEQALKTVRDFANENFPPPKP